MQSIWPTIIETFNENFMCDTHPAIASLLHITWIQARLDVLCRFYSPCSIKNCDNSAQFLASSFGCLIFLLLVYQEVEGSVQT